MDPPLLTPVRGVARADEGSAVSPTVSLTFSDQFSEGFSVKACENCIKKVLSYLNFPIDAGVFKAGFGELIGAG